VPAQEEDLPILIFLVVGAVVLALLVVFGVLSSRRKSRATRPSYEVRLLWEMSQPVLSTSSMNASDGKRQWEIFRQLFAPGTEVHDLPVGAPGGQDGPREVQSLRVSRVAREVREGWPQAQVGFLAYFEPYEFSEFPASFVLSGGRFARVDLDRGGVQVSGGEAPAWAASWDECRVAGRQDSIRLHNGRAQIELERSRTPDDTTLEALLVKYGVYWPTGAV